MTHNKKLLAAQSELGKLGINLSIGFGTGGSKAECLEERANLRRGINDLRNAAREALDKNDNKRAEELMEAIEACSEMISKISNQLDLDEVARQRFGGGIADASAGELRDRSGNRIGVMLSNSDLRDPSRVRAKLSASNDAAWDGQEKLTLGDFFRGVAGMRTSDAVRAALSEGTGASGGYTVPSILMPGILQALVPASSLLTAGAHVAMLNTQASSFSIAAVDTIPNPAWRSESGPIAESDAAFRSLTITPRSLAFRFKVSRELLADAPGLEQALTAIIAQAFAKEMDRAGLRGSGDEPEIKGLKHMDGVNLVGSGTNGAVLTNYAKFINAARLIKEANAPAANAAIMSPREDETVALFSDNTGQPLRRPDALGGWQFPVSSQIPTDIEVGTSQDCSEIYVGNFNQFTFFLREGISIQKLNELYAETGEIGFVCHTRLDVAAAYAAAFAVISGVRAPAAA